MAFNRGPDTLALTPDEHGEVYWQPLIANSVALQVATRISTDAAKYRVPVVTSTPSAEWTPEGQEISLSDPGTTEVAVTPAKLAALTKVSRELADDSAQQALNIVGQGMIRDLAQKTDEAFFGAPDSDEAPAGLQVLTGYQTVDEAAWTDTDAFIEAITKAEEVGATITSFVTSPAVARELLQAKESVESARHLIQPDPTRPSQRLIEGVPLFVSQYVEPDTVWALPREAVMAVLRTPAELAMSYDAAFTSYSVMVRIVQRLGFLFPHEAAVVKITAAAQGS